VYILHKIDSTATLISACHPLVIYMFFYRETKVQDYIRQSKADFREECSKLYYDHGGILEQKKKVSCGERNLFAIH